MNRVAKTPDPVTRQWVSRLILRAKAEWLPADRDREALYLWAGLLTLVGPPEDRDALRVFRNVCALLFNDGRSRQWANGANEVPANRHTVFVLSVAVEQYERRAKSGFFAPLGRARNIKLDSVVSGLVKISRAPESYLDVVAPLDWCYHPNVVFAPRTLDQMAGKLRGLLGELGSRDRMQENELEQIPRY